MSNFISKLFMSSGDVKTEIKRITNYSDAITNSISSIEEARIYKRAGLIEATVGGRPALINPKIKGRADNCSRTWYGRNHPSYRGWSNSDLMSEGYPPHDKRGDAYELHHVGQKRNSPLAELSGFQHMCGGNNAILHKCGKESEIDRKEFENERSQYWQARYLITKK